MVEDSTMSRMGGRFSGNMVEMEVGKKGEREIMNKPKRKATEC